MHAHCLDAQEPKADSSDKVRRTMKVFWNDDGRGIESDVAKPVDLDTALAIWRDDVRRLKGNFFGLVDERDRTVQFYFDRSAADGSDASQLKIVHLDFPNPELKGSYVANVTVGEVEGLIRNAFREGADYRRFENLKFSKW